MSKRDNRSASPDAAHRPSLHNLVPKAFPTPTVQDSANVGGPSQALRNTPPLNSVAAHLPSPRTSDTNGAGQHGTGGPDLRTVVSTMPTPQATDGTKGGPNQRGSSGDAMLPSVAAHLPTPTASLGEHRRDSGVNPERRRTQGRTVSTADIVCHSLDTAQFPAVQDWREYEPAIRRQEQAFGYPAPLPTEPNKNGNPRLSAAFSEWLMGLEPGWITDTPGITRNEALKAAGNGVVPQQCEAAARRFLEDYMREVAA